MDVINSTLKTLLHEIDLPQTKTAPSAFEAPHLIDSSIMNRKCPKCFLSTENVVDISNKSEATALIGLNIFKENPHVSFPEIMGYEYTIESIIIGIVLFTLVTVTVAGNVCVFIAVIAHKKLRTVSNMFIVSLSTTDLFLGTIVMIPAALNEIFDEWILSETFCSIWVSFDVMLCSASVLNVCLVSIDRYIAIMTPLRYRTLITHRRAIVMLCTAWSIAILTSFFPVESGLHNPDLPSLENLTIFSIQPKCIFVVSFPYAFVAGTVTILLPIIVALVLYYRVSKEAKRQAFFVRSLITPGNVLLGQQMSTKHIREPFTRKATWTLGIIVGAYVVTWTPFLITNNVDAYCSCVPSKMFIAFVWLGYCNSLINPIIYPLFMRDFRKVYISAIGKCCPYVQKIKTMKADKIYKGLQTPLQR